MATEAKVAKIRKQLDKCLPSPSSAEETRSTLKLLKNLQDVEMTYEILFKTGIGLTVNQLRKGSEDKEVATMAKALIKAWKKFSLAPSPGKEEEGGGNQVTKKTERKRSIDALEEKEGAPEKKKKLDTATPSTSKALTKAWKKFSLVPSPGKEEEKGNQVTKKTERKRSIDAFGEREGASEKKLDTATPSTSKQTPSVAVAAVTFPPLALSTSTNDAVRLKCRELLLNAVRGDGDLPDDAGDPEFLSEQLEEHIYQEFKNTDVKYKNRVRSRLANLKDQKNPDLRLNFLVGEISPRRLAKMTAEEMASAELKAMRNQFVKESIQDAQLGQIQGTKTDLLKCTKCGQRNCTYNQLQTRSADEPMTTFVLCLTCGRRWKFN